MNLFFRIVRNLKAQLTNAVIHLSLWQSTDEKFHFNDMYDILAYVCEETAAVSVT